MEQEPRLNFHRHGKFYIMGDIDETIPEDIIAPLTDEIIERCKEANPEPIKIFITSPGGRLDYAFDIIALFDMAKEMGVQIQTIVTSTACSAGSLIAVSGHRRFASERAYHLIHFAKSWDYSHNPEMAERNVANLKFLNKEAIKIYETKTKIKDVEKKMLADNFIINGSKALMKEGFIDGVI